MHISLSQRVVVVIPGHTASGILIIDVHDRARFQCLYAFYSGVLHFMSILVQKTIKGGMWRLCTVHWACRAVNRFIFILTFAVCVHFFTLIFISISISIMYTYLKVKVEWKQIDNKCAMFALLLVLNLFLFISKPPARFSLTCSLFVRDDKLFIRLVLLLVEMFIFAKLMCTYTHGHRVHCAQCSN